MDWKRPLKPQEDDPCPSVASIQNPTPANLETFAGWITGRARSLGWPDTPKVKGAEAWQFIPGWHAALGRLNELVDLARSLEERT